MRVGSLKSEIGEVGVADTDAGKGKALFGTESASRDSKESKFVVKRGEDIGDFGGWATVG